MVYSDRKANQKGTGRQDLGDIIPASHSILSLLNETISSTGAQGWLEQANPAARTPLLLDGSGNLRDAHSTTFWIGNPPTGSDNCWYYPSLSLALFLSFFFLIFPFTFFL